MKNTLGMSLLKFAIAFPIPIIFALFLNEVPSLRLKKFVQTGSYLPHFLSYVVIATIFTIFFGNSGFFNETMQKLGIIEKPIEYLAEPKWFWWLGVIIDVWKETGWHAIVFLAAIAGINTEIYEAAKVDGAGRMRRIFNITLPNIKRTIVVLFILNFGNLLSGGPSSSNFDQSYLLGNSFNKSTSYVVQYYTLHEGLNLMRYSFASAAGMVLSFISLGLMVIANYGSKKLSGESIF
jgi:putative aldouronate transport system permease protein